MSRAKNQVAMIIAEYREKMIFAARRKFWLELRKNLLKRWLCALKALTAS